MWSKVSATGACHPPGPAAPLGRKRCWPGPADPARAFGAANDRFYKIVARQAPGLERRQDARGEFDLVRRCRGLAGVPEALELIEDAHHQILVLQRVPGRPLSGFELGWLRF